jgi:hypothetical protein
MNPIERFPDVREDFFHNPNTEGGTAGGDIAFERTLGGANPPSAGLSRRDQPQQHGRQGQQNVAPTAHASGYVGYPSPASSLPPHLSRTAQPPNSPQHGGALAPSGRHQPMPPNPGSNSGGAYAAAPSNSHSNPYTQPNPSSHPSTSAQPPSGDLGGSDFEAMAHPRTAQVHVSEPQAPPRPLSAASVKKINNLTFGQIWNPGGRVGNEKASITFTRQLNQDRQASKRALEYPEPYSVGDVENYFKPWFEVLINAYGNKMPVDYSSSLLQLYHGGLEILKSRIGSNDRNYRGPAAESDSSSDAFGPSHANSSAVGGSRLDRDDLLAARYQLRAAAYDNVRHDFGQFHPMGSGLQPSAPQRLQLPSQKLANPASNQASSSAASGSGSKHAGSTEHPTNQDEPVSTRRRKGKAPAGQFDLKALPGYSKLDLKYKKVPVRTAMEIKNIASSRRPVIDKTIAELLKTSPIGDRAGSAKALTALEELNKTEPKIPDDVFLKLFNRARHSRSTLVQAETVLGPGGNSRALRKTRALGRIGDNLPPANCIIGKEEDAIFSGDGKTWVLNLFAAKHTETDIAEVLTHAFGHLTLPNAFRLLKTVDHPPPRA